jgi:hypothetical protein
MRRRNVCGKPSKNRSSGRCSFDGRRFPCAVQGTSRRILIGDASLRMAQFDSTARGVERARSLWESSCDVICAPTMLSTAAPASLCLFKNHNFPTWHSLFCHLKCSSFMLDKLLQISEWETFPSSSCSLSSSYSCGGISFTRTQKHARNKTKAKSFHVVAFWEDFIASSSSSPWRW